MKRLWCGAAGALIVLLGAVAMPPARGAQARPLAAPLLPGETLWNGVPSFDFGANDGVNWDPQENMDVAPDGPVIQGDLKAAGVPIARTWFFQNSLVDQHALTDAEQLQKLQAVQASGMLCFANFPTENTVAYDLHLLTILGTACPYVEVMNEPDIETAAWNNNKQIDPTAYLNFWNSFVPQARSAHPGILFGGPAEYDNQGDYCTYNNDGTSACFLQKVMTGMKASGNLPDFITYHWYPCWNDTAAQCQAHASGFASAAQQVIGWTDSIFGKPMPVICSEWNADPGSPNYMFDRAWDAQFVTAATQNIETSGLSGAMEFDISSYGNYAADDLFDIYSGGKPFATFTAYAAEIARVRGGGGPVNTPTPQPTSPATATPLPSTATATTGATPTATRTSRAGSPTATPTGPGAPAPLQSLSAYSANTLAPRVALARPVSARDELIATVALSADHASAATHVATITDTLGNTWTRIATGATTGATGGALAADIWATNATSSGADAITATLAGGPANGTSVRTILTVAELRGPATPDSGTAAASGGTRHTLAAPQAKAGDLLVGAFVSAGDDRGMTIADGKTQLGAVCQPSAGMQADQSEGGGTSVTFTTVSATAGEMVVAAFTT
ncbi:MAG TPA: hypothetical protein VIG30_16250 [Ktedonobacterales bacterium]